MAGKILLEHRRTNKIPVVVVVTDGHGNVGQSAHTVAARLHSEGLAVYAIAIGDDPNLEQLSAIVSHLDNLLDGPSAELATRFSDLLSSELIDGRASSWRIVDELETAADYVKESARPAALVLREHLTWERSTLPRKGITISYLVRPAREGVFSTSRSANASFIDGDSAMRSLVFPDTRIEVIRATLTPSPTTVSTPTTVPSPTIRRNSAYLPLMLIESCRPSQRRADVMLLIDASTSMLAATRADRSKLDAARAAVRGLIGELDLNGGDQVGLIAFNESVTLALPLSSNSAILQDALTSIEAAAGTCIPCAMERARIELLGPSHRAENTAAIVLLTDGQSNVRPIEEAIAEARRARDDGVEIFVVGLGRDVEESALRSMASRLTFYYQTLDAEALAEIFATIVTEIPCPAHHYWGRK